MPGPVLNNVKRFFKEQTGHKDDPVKPTTYKDSLLNLEPGLVYPVEAGNLNATFRFTISGLDGDQTVIVPFHELQRPLRGLNLEGKVVADNRYTELQIYSEPAENDAAVLGKAFLSQVWSFESWRNVRF